MAALIPITISMMRLGADGRGTQWEKQDILRWLR